MPRGTDTPTAQQRIEATDCARGYLSGMARLGHYRDMEFSLEGLGWKSFQDLSLMYVQRKFGVAAVSFSAGPDGGRDGAAVLTQQPHASLGVVVIQAKHSAGGGRLQLSQVTPELSKVKTLNAQGLCDTYVLVTNRTVSAPVEATCRNAIEAAGAQLAIVIGREELTRMLTDDKELRGLVPRVYGLGDLSEILDERLYAQTQALVVQNEMDRFVATGSYLGTLAALESFGFSLILGEPAAGKSSIMRAAAIHAADRWGLAPLWLDSVSELAEHWNTNRSDQLFLLDDAFGATNVDPERTDEWNRAIPRVRAAINGGAKFVLTSRDYVYAAARSALKSHELPVVQDGQVVIELNKISVPDRRQIVYNHLRLGGQPREFRAAAKPHLPRLTRSPSFLPETARRLGDPRFTEGLDPSDYRQLARFVDEPREYLLAVIEGLAPRLQVALLILVASEEAVGSPLLPSPLVTSVLNRFGLTRQQVSSALEELDGSLVRLATESGDWHWEVRHPTVVDAMGDWLLLHREMVDLYCEHASLSELKRQCVCGADVRGATSLPRNLWSPVFARMLAPTASTDTALRFLAYRCSWEAISSNQSADLIELLGRRRFSSPLDSDPKVRLYLRLCERGGLGPQEQQVLLEEAVDVALEAFDPYVLAHDGFEEVAISHPAPGYWLSVVERFLDRVRENLESHLTLRMSSFDSLVDRLDAMAGVAALLRAVEDWTDDPVVLSLIATQRDRMVDWVGDDQPTRATNDAMERFVQSLFGLRTEEEDLFSDVDA